MTDSYFCQDHGQTVGPLKLEELRARIQDGRVRTFDLIYREGENVWRMALEHPSLRGEFKAGALAALRERPWVCLRRKTKEGLDFTTTGPFTPAEIRTRLQSGEISYSDYAWKDGFQEWKRIGALEEFNPRARSAALPPVPPLTSDSSVDLLKNVVELQRSTPVVDSVPNEAKGEDLTASGNSVGHLAPPLPRIERSAPPPPARAEIVVKPRPPAALPSLPEELGPETATRPLFDWGLVGVLILILAGMVLIISRLVQPRPAPEIPVAAAVESPPSDPSLPALAQPGIKAKEAQKSVVSASRPPQEILLSVQTVNNQAHIDLRTDGSTDFPVFVQIVGLPGQISEGGAFYRFLHLTPTGSLAQPVDLSGLKLPEGHFVVRADSGNVKKEVKFSWGLNDPRYKIAVLRQRKLWAGPLWRERLTLFRLSDSLQKQLTSLTPGARFSPRGLDSIMSLKRTNPGDYLLFDEWWELHQIALEAKQEVSPQLVARAEREHERMATLTFWK